MEEKQRVELERIFEEKHLTETINIIKEEILNYVEKRKKVTEGIVDYRKKAMEFYEDDEDRVAEFFDHEAYVLQESFRATDKKIKELTVLKPSPYFGRVDFREEDGDVESIYVGRYGLIPEGTFEPVIVDWRAPISSMFYAGKLGEAKYSSTVSEYNVNILLKRQFIIKKEKLVGMFDSAVDVKDEILQKVLSENTSEKLKDIVMSIQEEQDYIIRRPREKTVIVNGVAGSGKTTIALHRVAYLLYNFREIMQDKVLILGPNHIFMEYISTVLPSLGEVGVNQKTFSDFALEFLDLDSTDILSTKDYMESILSNDKKFIDNLLRKTSKEFIVELDKLVESLNEKQDLREVKYLNKVAVSLEEIKEMYNKYYKDMPLFRRKNKIKRIVFSKLKDVRDERIREINEEHKKKIENSTPQELKLNLNKYEFEKKIALREAIKEMIRVKNALGWLENSSIYDIYKEFVKSDVFTSDDLAPLIYLRVKLEDIKSNKEIKHVVIDEAQDYSMLQFKVIKMLTKALSMTIVGDSNQRIVPLKDELAMVNLDKEFNEDIEMLALNKSYRSTQQIMEFANKFLKDERIIPLVRQGEEVKSIEVANDEELLDELLDALYLYEDKEYESIAVIARDAKECERLANLLKDEKQYIKLYNREDMIYKGGKIIIPSYLSKGLEFDGVITVSKKSSEENDKLSYVMSTRALHGLTNIIIK
ncbi:MAG: UvrD-helicase domain-containing protein [Clostridiaceae bacterium]